MTLPRASTQELGHLVADGRMVKESPVPAIGDDDDAPRRRPIPGVGPVARMGGRDEDVVRAEDGELVAREWAREVGGAERYQAPHRAPLVHLDQVAGHEAAQAMADEIDLRRARLGTE